MSVHQTKHDVVIRIAIDRDDANLLCRSDLDGLGLRPFIMRWVSHDLRTAFARCVDSRQRFRTALLERGSGTASVTTTTLTTATTAAKTTPLTVPASVSVSSATLTGARPLSSGTSTVTLTADWTQMHAMSGLGAVCAPATGSATFTGTTTKSATTPASSGTITMSLAGKLCAARRSAAGTTSGSFFMGKYTVTSGTGVTATTAASVVGHGRFALSVGSDNTAKFVAAGGLSS